MDWLTKGILRSALGEDALAVLGDSDEAKELVKELEEMRIKGKKVSVVGGLLLKAAKDAAAPKTGMWAALKSEVERQRLARAEEAHAKAVAEKPFWAMIKETFK